MSSTDWLQSISDDEVKSWSGTSLNLYGPTLHIVSQDSIAKNLRNFVFIYFIAFSASDLFFELNNND